MLETLLFTGGKYIPFDLTPLKDFYWTNDYVQRLFHVRDWTWSEAVGNTYHFTNRNNGREEGIRIWRSTVYFDQNSLPAEPHLVLPPGSTSFTDPDAPRGSRFFYLLEVFKGPLDREFTGPFEASALGINVGPGPQDLIAGNPGAGFYGEVPVGDLITGNLLASTIGLTAGTAQHSNEPWLKFNLDGKALYVAKKPYRHSISWDQINAANAVYGDRTIEINGESFKVRLLKGASTNPAENIIGYDPASSHGSEWNRLMYPLVNNITSPNSHPKYPLSQEDIRFGSWANYTEVDLVVHSTGGNGSLTWCQEVDSSNAARRVIRGHSGLSFFNFNTSSSTFSTYGWRPCLELVS